MRSLFEEMDGTYRKEGDYLLPNVEAPQNLQIGIWGQRRKQHLQKHRYPIYVGMLLSGSLDSHLIEIDAQAEEMMLLLVNQMMQQEGVDEGLKESDQMEWVKRMNNIRQRAIEVVLEELIFV